MTMPILKTLLLSLALFGLASAHAAAPRFVYGPYKYLAMAKAASHEISVAHDGVARPFIADGRSSFGQGALTWAFATGECGDEKWGDDGADDIAKANVAAFEKAGVDYIISTGGQGGVFTCSSDAGMARFIARYASKRLAGIDFDIEAGQTPEQIASLIRHARNAQKKHPALRFSFTVATHAASDGSRRSLNAMGEAILAEVRKSGLRGYTFNLMVMDYGTPSAENCVVRGAVCDMGKSAIQAARNVHARYKIPYSQLELTPMIGVNDVPANDFTLEDARVVADAVRRMKMAGLHFWSLDRDTPCTAPTPGASSSCSTMKLKSGEFGRALSRSMP
jgi:chitinase